MFENHSKVAKGVVTLTGLIPFIVAGIPTHDRPGFSNVMCHSVICGAGKCQNIRFELRQTVTNKNRRREMVFGVSCVVTPKSYFISPQY